MMKQKRTDTIDASETIAYRRAAGKKRSRIIFLILVLILGCAAYGVKSRLGINLFESMSTSSHFPFNYLHNDVLEVNQPGIVVYEDFEQSRIFKRWSDSSFRHDTNVVHERTQGGQGNDTRCLQVSSDRTRRWAYVFSKYIPVNKGDRFQVKGRVHLKDGSTVARLSTSAFDAEKRPIDWNLAAKSVKKEGSWVHAEKQFSITNDEVRYIRFRLTGGLGVYRFDDLLLSKLAGPNDDK